MKNSATDIQCTDCSTCLAECKAINVPHRTLSFVVTNERHSPNEGWATMGEGSYKRVAVGGGA